jgi:branched-chain amino acid transport system permease protein
VSPRTIFRSTEAGVLAFSLLAVAAVVPLVYTSPYGLGVLTTMLILMVLNTSWNLLLGIAGVWNFGQLAIYAIGGYGAGIIMLRTGLPGPVALVGGGLAGAAASVLLAFPTLRLRGMYTALLTFSFAQIVSMVIVNDNTGLTGGPFGLDAVDGLFSGLSPQGSLRAYYWLALVVLVVARLAVGVIRRSSFGLALTALRDAPGFAAARGVDPLRTQVVVYGIAGFLAGIAGALAVCFDRSIGPEVMSLSLLSLYVTAIVVGGMGTIMGPIVGTAILTALDTALVDEPALKFGILGVILLAIVLFVPQGVFGGLVALKERVARWVAEDEDDEDDAEDEEP